jgi:hypothetical protein
MVKSSAQAEATGGCLCGAVRFSISGALRDILICHCAMCRRSSSSVGAYTACAPDAIAISGTKLRWYRSSPMARRGFCSKCGSQLFWEPNDGHHISVSAGSLDDASALAIAEHIFVAHDPTALRSFAPPPA